MLRPSRHELESNFKANKKTKEGTSVEKII